jgi:arylsulfatase A-like enzyme
MAKTLPNVLLIVADCGRSDKWLGHGRTTVTPNVDRLAAQGVSLPCTITEKSCTSPSIVTLLTGLFCPRHGVHYVFGYRLPECIPTLTEVLAEHGYNTYAEATGPLLPEMGLVGRFDHYEYRSPYDYLDTEWGAQFVDRLRNGHYRKPWFLIVHLWELHLARRVLREFRQPQFGRNEYEQSVSSLDAQLGRVFEAVDGNTITIFTSDHGETTPDEEYRDGTAVAYARRRLGLDQAEGLPLYKVGWVAGPSVLYELYGRFAPQIKDMRLDQLWPKPQFGVWDRLLDRLRLVWLLPLLYAHDLVALGAPLKLTKLLRKRGMLNPQRAQRKVSRLIKAVGHDRMIQMHMRMWINTYKVNMQDGHGVHVYDFLNRVPLVIRWPGHLPTGAVIQRMVREPDILPTIMELVGIDARRCADIDGRSFKPLLHHDTWQPRPAYLSLTGFTSDLELRGVRTEAHKYTYGPRNPDLPEELYDLNKDPREAANIAAHQPRLCEQLRQQAESLMPAGAEIESEMLQMTPDEQGQIERRLRDLGYID